MPRVPYNSVGGFSTGLTMTGVIDSLGNITGVGATFSGLIRANAGISASGGTFSGDIAVNGGDITTTSTSATLFNANATTLNILNTQSSGFTLNIGTASSFSGTKRINIGSNIGGGASSEIIIGHASSASMVSILGGITLGGVAASVVRVASPSTFDVTATSTFTNSTFSGLLSANAGISASGITVGGSIVLQNQEFIRNTTNGRMDFMPAPAGSTHYGMYMDFTSWEYGTKLGTIRASDGSLNAAGFLFDASITIGNNVRTSLGNNGQNGIVLADTGNDTIQLYTSTTSGTNSGAIAIVDLAGQGAANRSPGVTHTNPNLYVYRSGSVSANDFIRMEHDGTVGRIVSGGTSGLLLQPGSGVLAVDGGISASGGFTFGSPSGTTFMVFKPTTSCTNGGLWIRDGNLQLGGSFQGSGQGAFYYSPCGEQFIVGGYSTFQNSYNYQAGRSPLRLNSAPTQSVPILAAYKQTSDGTQLTNTFTTTNMVAGIDQNGALFSTVGISAAGGITFTNNVQANGYILSSNARSWFL